VGRVEAQIHINRFNGLKQANYLIVNLFGMIHLLLILILSPSIEDKQPAYLQFINPEKIGVKQTEIDADSTIIERTYLGQLKLSEALNNKKINYHVISEFRLIQAATTKRGKSCVLFIDENGQVVRQYNLDLHIELPTAIKDNYLIFGDRTLTLSHLPDLLCIPNGACYDWEE
jgi:hypothetical protein